MLEWFETFFNCAEIIGTIAFAASGAMIAIDRKLDLFGVLFLGITVAVGGGMTRDVLLGFTPPSAFRNPVYVAVAAATALTVFLFAYFKRVEYKKHYHMMDQVINLLDAIGLGIFGVVGVETAMDMGHEGNMFLCVFMGMLTAVGGGILRDIFSKTIPAVLQKRIYAVASIVGCIVYYVLRAMEAAAAPAMFIGMLVTVAVRLCASHYHWNLPKVDLD